MSLHFPWKLNKQLIFLRRQSWHCKHHFSYWCKNCLSNPPHRVLVDLLTPTENSKSKTSIFEYLRGRPSTPQNIKMICRPYPLHKIFFESFSKLLYLVKKFCFQFFSPKIKILLYKPIKILGIYLINFFASPYDFLDFIIRPILGYDQDPVGYYMKKVDVKAQNFL